MRDAKRAFVIVGLTTLCMAVCSPLWGDASQTDETSPAGDEREIQDLVYLAPRAPIFVRLRIKIHGQGLQTQRESYAQELFDKLDATKDGRLDDEEMAAVPPPGHLVPVGGSHSTSSVARIGGADDDGNGSVTPAELTSYILRASGALCQINTAVQQPSNGQPVQLFDRLDRNHDGQLSADEMSNAARHLRLMDFDLDERIQAEEIRPPTVFGVQQQADNSPASQASASLALLEPINHNGVDDALIRRMIQQYDKLGRTAKSARFSKDRRLSAEELGQEPQLMAEFDQNQDGLLDRQELRRFLANPRPTCELSIEFSDESTTPKTELVVHGESSPTAPLEISANENGRIVMRLAAARFEIVADAKLRAVRARRFLGAFAKMDRDGNDYLDRDELRQMRGLDTDHFALIDDDGDGMVVAAEFTSFAEQQAELQKHVVSLSLVGDDKSLFSLVDTSGDGRLDVSELATIETRLRENDRNSDGNLDKAELTGGLRMILTRGDVEIAEGGTVFRAAVNSFRAAQQQHNAGGWFAKMDRNRDGRVSKREFLGPLDDFTQMDVDKSGWLDPTESN